jgi:hypothetical protein
MPPPLDRVRLCPSTHINETDRMVGGMVSTHQDILDPHLTAHHAGWNEAHILQELDAEVGVAV